MNPPPIWYEQLGWEGPFSFAHVNTNRNIIPRSPGVYVFTDHPRSLLAAQVLYVGETSRKQGLRGRLAEYLVDFEKYKKTNERHKGKAFVLFDRSRLNDHGVYMRWALYGGSKSELRRLEASLISLLKPVSNSRDEDARFPLLGDEESLDSRLIG